MYKYIDEKGEHMHTFNGTPLIGTSSVASVLAKPLTWWASGLAVMQLGIPDSKVITKIKNKTATQEEVKACMVAVGIRLEEIKQMDAPAFYKVLDGAYRAHQTTLKDKAEEGTDLHAELERYVKNTMLLQGTGTIDTTEYEPRIQPFIDWTKQNVKRFLWSEAHCFSEKMWTGGISDAGTETNEGKVIVIDFKSSKEAYLSQFWQCVGYAMQIEENGWYDKDGNCLGTLEKPIDYVCVVPFGATKVEPQFNFDMAGGKDAFIAELVLYKKLNV
jgi:hypothetical protein